MLSYLHAYHAGNFADVHKHLALFLAVSLMQRKETPIAFFDTHAGSARYNLRVKRPARPAESDSGILALNKHREALRHPDWSDSGPYCNANGVGHCVSTRVAGLDGGFASAAGSITAFELHPREQGALQRWAKPAG